MFDSIVIRGVGLVTPLGDSAATTLAALMRGQTIRETGRCRIAPVAARGRVIQLAELAAREAIATANWKSNDRGAGSPVQTPVVDTAWAHETALIVGTSKGTIDDWISAPPAQQSPRSDNPKGEFWPLGVHRAADDLAGQLGLFGPRQTVSAACASGLYAMAIGAMLIRHGTIKRAVIVGAESSLHPLMLQSYRRLGVLAADGELTRPFDHDRGGFLVSEAAAAVCIEKAVPVPGDIVLNGVALGGDANHLTGMDPRGAALRRVIVKAVGRRPIDLFQAHATGTLMNDPIELAAIESTVAATANDAPLNRPVVFSHKGALGHTMGASGMISIVLNTMMHRQGQTPPNTNTRRPLDCHRVTITDRCIDRPIHRSVAIAAGFGGPVAAIGLTTCM